MYERFNNMMLSGRIDMHFYFLYYKEQGGTVKRPIDFYEAFDNALRNGTLDINELNDNIRLSYGRND